MCLLCIMNALPTVIFFISPISWRAFWALALADFVLSRAAASSDACVFESSSKLSCFFHESLELFLHLLHPRLLLPSLCALRGRSIFGLGQRFLKGCHLGRGPYNSTLILSFFATTSSLYTCARYYLPSFSSSCLLAWPSSFSDRARFCFSVSTSAVSAAEASSEACIRILT